MNTDQLYGKEPDWVEDFREREDSLEPLEEQRLRNWDRSKNERFRTWMTIEFIRMALPTVGLKVKTHLKAAYVLLNGEIAPRLLEGYAYDRQFREEVSRQLKKAVVQHRLAGGGGR